MTIATTENKKNKWLITFLSAVKQKLLFPVALVDFDDLQSCQDLQDHSGSYDRTDS